MREILIGACRHILRRKSRAALTGLGVGVGAMMVALVTLVAAGGGAAVNGELRKMGVGGLSLSAVSAGADLGEEELELVREVEGVERAMPLMMAGGKGELGPYEFTAYIGGIDGGARQVISLETAHGRLLTAGDVATASAVCVVDESVARAAYGRANALGKTLWLTVGEITRPLTVVGVAKAGSSLLQGLTGYLSGLVYLPYTTLWEMGVSHSFIQIAVTASDTGTVGDRMLTALERYSGVKGGFAVRDLAARREQLGSLLDLVAGILTAISAVSLLVAGIGVLTSMLTALQERVREIGIKLALGASRGRILAEFLTEAILLSLAGAVAGTAAGALLGWIGLRLLEVEIALPAGRLLTAVAAAGFLGAACGWIPARKAAMLPPAQALRNE